MRRADRVTAGAAVVMASALVGLSISRTAMIVWFVAFVVALLARERRSVVIAVGMSAMTLLLSVGLRLDGWASRGKASVAGVEQSGSGRMALNRQAVQVFKTEPWLGVGLVNYRDTIRAHPEIDALSGEDYVVHNAPLFMLASSGLVGTISLLPLGVVLVDRARRGGVWGVGLLATAGPVLLLTQQFFVGIGYMWFGVVAGLALQRRQQCVEAPDAASQAKPFRSDTFGHRRTGERVTIG